MNCRSLGLNWHFRHRPSAGVFAPDLHPFCYLFTSFLLPGASFLDSSCTPFAPPDDLRSTSPPLNEADPKIPSLITDRIADKAATNSGKLYPNGNMKDAHAEIGVIQQAYSAGKTTGADMSMTVAGKDVCGFCKGDIAAAAEKAELKSLTVSAIDDKTGLPKNYYWEPGMKSIKEKK
ncbi:cytidine deaminase-like fold-containing protein [Pseudomonas sp. TH49]|uniref:cytidine deaminase-like fold-containing protein n=1 Tax=Pseudomonas sp. TH49 TaxID=2796413 RepID=UPI00406CB2FF